MKTKNHDKITKTIIAGVLVWSQKANGIPKQEIIDQIFTGLNRGSIKKGGEQITEHTYTDAGSNTKFAVDFAQKTIQIDDKQLIAFSVAEEEKPQKVKAPKATKAEKVKQPKLSKKEAAMQKQTTDIKEFLDKNFELEYSDEGKVKRFRLKNKEDKQLGVDAIYGGVVLCVLKRINCKWEDAEQTVKEWMREQRSANQASKAAVEKIAETADAENTVDVTAKSPSPRTTVGNKNAKKARKRK